MQCPIWSALSVAAVFGLLDKPSRTDEVGDKIPLIHVEVRDYVAATLICFFIT